MTTTSPSLADAPAFPASVEASDLAFPVGVWPVSFLYCGAAWYRRDPISHDGEFAGYRYVTQALVRNAAGRLVSQSVATLLVWND